AQETKLHDGGSCTRCDTGQPVGKLPFDDAALIARLRLGPGRPPLPERLDLGPGGPINNKALVEALYRFADSLVAGDGRYAALERVLRREPPQLMGRTAGQPIVAAGQDLLQGSLDAAQAMDHTHLYVQGPPGSGKTFTGARMVACLLAAGKSVGILSNSHKAINHLLGEVMKVVREQRLDILAIKKCTARNPETHYEDNVGDVRNMDDNGDVWANDVQLVAGTAWLFADARADQRLDVLFVDEAGQVALANLLAAGTSARSIVLLGDQMQLSQPVQGVHPGGSGDSALDYLLDGAATIAPDRGIFLATSYRMHPFVCRFISDAVYDSRLMPEPGNARRTLVLGDQAHP
ncbi:MAG: AAA family ATPase, partial [Dehalococcoidia bacterium]|nr:AAA family ATPase [Dehalococcoidia bacterium]